jgi:hypothetical protein
LSGTGYLTNPQVQKFLLSRGIVAFLQHAGGKMKILGQHGYWELNFHTPSYFFARLSLFTILDRNANRDCCH